MAHFVRVLPYKTFRLHPAACPPYNADFDGDEMNIHGPQTEEARAEAKVLLNVQSNLISPKNNTNLIGITDDAITGNYVLSESEVEEAHNYLLKYKHLQNMLFSHRGWLLETILKFKLGWNDKEKRVQIPIYDENGQLKNIRKYLVLGKPTTNNPKFRGVRGHNENYFFPIDNLIKEEFILLCAGEPDTILACQCGFNAGTFTSGEGSFNRNLLPYFKNKLVYICYDKDLAGFRALKQIGPELTKYAKEVKIIDLPFGG
jgi:hypothetical protein